MDAETHLFADPYSSVMTTAFERFSVRDRTRDELLRLIVAHSALTRPEIVELTGMSRTTVNQAISRLIADGLIVEAEPAAKGPGSGSGRPATTLQPVAQGLPVAGIDIGHSHIQVAVADSLGRILGERFERIDVDLHATRTFDLAARLVEELRIEHSTEPLAQVVSGVPGPLDVHSGLIESPTILSGWVGLDPAAELERRIGTPTRVENDAVLGAIGELRAGAGRSMTSFLYVKASHGIGAGLIINGVPYRGAGGIAGEIGHINLPGHTEICRCGNRGCLEAVISVEAVRSQIAQTHPGEDPLLVSLDDLIDDTITRRILGEAGRTLGRVLAPMCDLLNPQGVVVGGELGQAGPHFIEGITDSITRHSMPATTHDLAISGAQLGVRSELLGAVGLAAELAAQHAGRRAGVRPRSTATAR
jgi:predicted NBD/HSP70 family sugar kinase